MKLKVIQGSGDNLSADPIIDELMTSEAVATERGRNFLAEESTHKWIYDLNMASSDWVAVGSLVEINDSQLGEIFRGKSTSFSIDIQFDESSGPSVETNVNVEKSEDYSE